MKMVSVFLSKKGFRSKGEKAKMMLGFLTERDFDEKQRKTKSM